jgi:hypothetical protein
MAGNSAGVTTRYLNSSFLTERDNSNPSLPWVSLSQFHPEYIAFSTAVPLKLMKCNFEFRPTCSKVKWASKAKPEFC